MSKKENVKSRTENLPTDLDKTSLSRSGSLQNLKLESGSGGAEASKEDDSPQPSFRAIKPRLVANMASGKMPSGGPPKSASSRKSSGQRSKQLPADVAGASPSAEDVETARKVTPSQTGEAASSADDTTRTDLRAMENEKLRDRIDFILRKNKQLEEEKEKIEIDRNESMKNIERVLSQNRELSAENMDMKEQQQRDSKTIEELQKQTSGQEQRIQKLKEDNRILNESHLKAVRELQSVNQEKNDLGKSHKAQQAELKKLTADKQKDAAKLEQAEQRYTKLRADHQEATQQIEQLRSELRKYEELADDLKSESRRRRTSSTAVVSRDDVGAKSKTAAGRGATKK